jgi:hypothetical protein
MDDPLTKEGFVDFEVLSVEGLCQTYYKVVGDLQGGKRPLVVLHGGIYYFLGDALEHVPDLLMLFGLLQVLASTTNTSSSSVI